jgi:hypothetical protein
MKPPAPSLSPLLAFVSTVALLLLYFVATLALMRSTGTQASNFAGSFHVLLVWVLPAISAAFYSWVSRGAAVSPLRRLVQVAAATVLAPIVAGSIIGVVGFALLGWSI